MDIRISDKDKHRFKGFCFTPEIIMLVVYMKCRFSLSYRELEELAMMRGIVLDHATCQRWIIKFVSFIEEKVRRRKKPVGKSWRMDETYIKAQGKWVYLYRAVDKYGNTIDFLLQEYRDLQAAKAFFKKSINRNGEPESVVIDKRGSKLAALKSINKNKKESDKIKINRSKYLNNIVEQDHRFIKKRIKPMLGFKSIKSAKITLAGIECVHMIKKCQVWGSKRGKLVFENFVNLMAY